MLWPRSVSGVARVVQRASALVQQVIWHLAVNVLIAAPCWPRPLRWRMLRLVGADIEPCTISPNAYIGSSSVRIGAGTRVGYGAYLDGVGPVSIGRKCAIGTRAVILTGYHPVGDASQRSGPIRPEPVTIGDGAWVGSGATILPGVTVGPGCVVAAGAVVTRDCEPDGVYAGVPARRIKDL